jgi:hypothetical protein
LGRVGALPGPHPPAPHDRIEFWLALRARELVAP